jgi:hypothetical protein
MNFFAACIVRDWTVPDSVRRTPCTPGRQNGSVIAMTRYISWTAAVVAIFCAAILGGATASRAATVGNAPWCAVINMGDGDVIWDCEYATVEQCVPNVLAGNRGFCNVNPYGPPMRAATQLTPRKHRTYRN